MDPTIFALVGMLVVAAVLLLLRAHEKYTTKKEKPRRSLTVYTGGKLDLPPGKTLKIRLTPQNCGAVSDFANRQEGYIKRSPAVDEEFLLAWVYRAQADGYFVYARFYSTNVAGVLG